MKTGKKRKKINNLYILGAGASYGLSKRKKITNKFLKAEAPLDKNFISRLDTLFNSMHHRTWQSQSWDKIKSGWIGNKIAKNEDKFLSSGLEGAIIKRLGNYNFLSEFHSSRVRGCMHNEEYLNHLSHLITDSLYKCGQNKSGDIDKFVEKVFPKKKSSRSYEDRVITFNYDTIIDKILLKRTISPKKIYFDNISLEKNQVARRKLDKKFPDPLIIKMHGSINWRCETDYFNYIIGREKETIRGKSDIWIDNNCPKPSDNISPLIIPPIPFKPITDISIFRFLWQRAYEYLYEAKNIIIIGYSCPETDTLARSMFTQFKNNNVDTVTVVDPSAAILGSYRKMMKPCIRKDTKWRYFSDINEYLM